MNRQFRQFKTAAASTLLVLAALGGAAQAQPSFGNPSPTAGSWTIGDGVLSLSGL